MQLFWGRGERRSGGRNCVPPNLQSIPPARARGKCNFCASVSGQAPFCAVKWNEITEKKGNKESEKRVIKCTTDKSTNMKKIIRVPNLKKTMFSTFFHMYNTIKVRLSVDLFVRLNHQKIDCSLFVISHFISLVFHAELEFV